MDYRPNETRWSPCSKEDLQKYFDQVTAENGGCFCLSHIKGPQCEPEVVQPSPCTDKSKDCDKSKCDKGGNAYKINCLNTCGFCPYGPGSCLDKYSNCQDMVSRGDTCKFGNNPTAIHHRLMCRKSCNICSKDIQPTKPSKPAKPTKPSKPSKPAKPTKPIQPNPTQNTYEIGPCQNKPGTRCNRNMCKTKNIDILEKCMKTCGFCPYGANSYIDKWRKCSSRYATTEWCKVSNSVKARKIRLNCRKSCKRLN